jgi:BolA protein
MSVKDSMERKLMDGLAPSRLDIVDDSHRHAGHAGSRPGGESHFTVQIVSAAFEGKGQVSRQRLVYALLADEMQAVIHALALTTLTPDEASRRGLGS